VYLFLKKMEASKSAVDMLCVTVIHKQCDGTETSKRVTVSPSSKWADILKFGTSLNYVDISSAFISPLNDPGRVLDPFVSFSKYSQLQDSPEFSIIVRVPTQEEQDMNIILQHTYEELGEAENELGEANRELIRAKDILNHAERRFKNAERNLTHAEARTECVNRQAADLRERKRSRNI
jgi:hypothetical protein